ncbi:MAG TPA: outer membrane beta-barrel protein [Stellaceae bacterium]|nr:outer membrane beta-barrel protein [Stellaceae bacterium]
MVQNISMMRAVWVALLGLLPATALAQVEPISPIPTPPVAPGQAAPATQPGLATSVANRARPDYDPIGLREGPWFLYPRLGVDEVYNDNIFATTTGKVSDFITVLSPTLDLRSNFTSNALNFSVGSVVGLYAQNSRADYQDAFANGSGRIDIDKDSNFHGTANYTRGHIDFTSPLSPGGIQSPVTTNAYGGTAGYEQARLRIGYSVDVAALRTEYEAVPLIGGGLLPESHLNNWAYEGTGRVSYEFLPNTSAYVRAAYNRRSYDHGQSAAFPTLDSQGYRADIGGRVNFTDLLYADLFFGYLQQFYRAPVFGTISGPDAGATVTWDVTKLTSLTFTATRSVQDANVFVVGTSPGYLRSAAGARVDHELFRNVLLNGTVAWYHDDYQGVNLTDDNYQFGAGVKYLLNRHLYLGLNYTYVRYLPSGTAAGVGNASVLFPYTQNIVMLRASTQF